MIVWKDTVSMIKTFLGRLSFLGGEKVTTIYKDKDCNITQTVTSTSCITVGDTPACKEILTKKVDNKIVISIVPLRPKKFKTGIGDIEVTKLVSFSEERKFIVLNAATGPQFDEELQDISGENYTINSVIGCDDNHAGGFVKSTTISNGTNYYKC